MSSLPVPPPFAELPSTYPVRIADHGDLQRSRLTVFFRLLLAIPHVVVLMFWGLAAYVVVFVAWIAGTILGRIPEGMHGFLEGFLRYNTSVTAYTRILSNPYPPFSGSSGSYTIDLEVDPPGPQSRLTIFFRGLLALPMLLIGYGVRLLANVLTIAAWFAALVLGSVPEGLQDTALWCLRYEQRVLGYLLFLTARYPGFS